MIPKYKILTYTGAVLDHTITSDALSIASTEVITDGVGNFTFFLPSEAGGSNIYDDIAVHDKVCIYYGWDAVGASANFIGYITDIAAPVDTEGGYIRQYSGLSQGEILLRRHLIDTRYTGTNASVIVAAWAAALGLGVGDITANANQPTFEVQTKTYFDALRDISDFWIDGANQIKNDFYVDTDFDLVWKPRPFRTAGVDTITVGSNVHRYTLTRDVKPVINYVRVYGAPLKTFPTTADALTEQAAAETPADDDWTSDGTLAWSGTCVVGSESLSTSRAASNGTYALQSLLGVGSIDCTTWKKNSYNTLSFQIQVTDNPDGVIAYYPYVTLYAPTLLHSYRQYLFDIVKTLDEWYTVTLPLGVSFEHSWMYGDWCVLAGSPDWANVQAVRFDVVSVANGLNAFLLDDLQFSGARFYDYATDAASVAAYGTRQLELVDDRLTSDALCEQRAETILYQRKDPTVEADVTVTGSTNILVGDRLSLTLPKEGITATNFDVTRVTNTLTPSGGWTTRFIAVNSGNLRTRSITTRADLVNMLLRKFKKTAEGESAYP